MQRRLARVRRSDQRDLRRPFRTDHQRRAAVAAALPATFELLAKVLDAGLDVGLQVLGSLVLGNRAQHLAQPLEALARLARAAEARLGGLVLGGEVGWHAG
jgi:hypothetical protein